MKLSTTGLAIAAAVVWGGYGMFLTGMANLFFPQFGEHFLLTMSSVYPGYHASRNIVDVLVGTGYGIVDGGVAGFLFAWIYNAFV